MLHAVNPVLPRSTPLASDPILAERATSALRAALEQRSRSDGRMDGFRTSLAAFCQETKLSDVAIEHLLIAIKLAWAQMPEVRSLPMGTTRSSLLERVISTCIAEYYRGSR